MAIKFGMTVAQIIGQLTRGFMKAMNRKPDGLEKIKIQQEAVQRFKDMNKVVDMGGTPIDTSKGIMGGTQVGQKGMFDNIFARMQKDMGKNIKEVKNKKPDPEKKATGGRIGLKEGEGIMQMASAPDIMDERNEMSLRMFKKPIDVLTPEEMDILEEEIMRLMEKFSKVDRGAPSITLADGGRAAFKDGPFKRGIKAITNTDTYKTLEDRGFNTAVTLNYAFDEIFNLLSGIPFADGGRAAFKDGPKDPRRRTFMKAAAGIVSMLPFGGAKLIGKAAPVVAKAAEITGPALAKLVDTVMSVGKLISVKGKRVKEMVTKKKHQGVEVTEDVADQSYTIKKGGKEIYYKPGRMDESGGIDDDIIEVIEETVTKKAGGGIARMLGE